MYECVCVCVFLPCAVGNHISHSAESLCLLTSTMSQWDSFPQSVRSNRFLYWCENCRTIRQSGTYFSSSSIQKCTAHLRQNKNIKLKKKSFCWASHAHETLWRQFMCNWMKCSTWSNIRLDITFLKWHYKKSKHLSNIFHSNHGVWFVSWFLQATAITAKGHLHAYKNCTKSSALYYGSPEGRVK